MANFIFNKIMLGGRLTADPENKQTTDGISVTTFTVAVNRRNTAADGKPASDFFKVIAWRSLAEFVYKFFKKGSAIFVVGEVQNRSWTDNAGNKRYVTEIIASEAHFVDSKLETPSPFPASAENGANGDHNSKSAGDIEKPAPLPSDYYTAEDFAKVSGDDDLPF